jgi:hypothetical protein
VQGISPHVKSVWRMREHSDDTAGLLTALQGLNQTLVKTYFALQNK